MRKFIFVILIVFFITTLTLCLSRNHTKILAPKDKIKIELDKTALIKSGRELLKIRKDRDALAIFEKILSMQPDNVDALWGKAEVLRRSRDYPQAEKILNEILKQNSKHSSSVISLAYIKYKNDKLNEALKLINQVLKNCHFDRENLALAYVILGSINIQRYTKEKTLSKIIYGSQIRSNFLKAKKLAPDLPETSLALGTFYLLAPKTAGGNLDKAIKELELAVKLSPNFATANARLAQCYKKMGDLDRYNFYLKKAKELDPENEILKENEIDK